MSEKEKLPWGLTQIAPGSIKGISKDKLTAFDQGTFVNKAKLSKKEQDELRKKQEEEAAKEVLHDFCESFEKSNKTVAKMFVKGSIINPKDEKSLQDKGALYKPALKLISKSSTPTSSPLIQRTQESVLNKSLCSAQSEIQTKLKKPEKEKKKSNLELFKEELKRAQTERDERHKKKPATSENEDIKDLQVTDHHMEQQNTDQNSQDSGSGRQPTSVEDPNTTNIFISNLSPKTIEQDLMQRFGHYGLLASVKIMWPRSDDEKVRNANCGFVAFMNRKDADLALKELDGISVNSQTMRLSWSKAITLPLQPVYIPPELIEVTIPPPPSGLPFNAQPQDNKKLRLIRKQIQKFKKRSRSSSSSGSSSSSRSRSSSVSSTSSNEEAEDEFTRSLEKALVKVVIPTDRTLLCLIHRMIEFVVHEGPAFEAMIMVREINNPQFRFLFDNKSPAHSYYRWKLYSLMHGESVSKWRTAPFRMFKNGSYWQPPPLNRYTQGSPDEAYEKAKIECEVRRGNLCNEKRDKLEDILRNINSERKSISDAMVFCLDNAEKAEEIVEVVVESLMLDETPLNKKAARLYLVSDILHNCCAKVANASYYRRGFEKYLPEIFEHISEVWKKIDGKMKAEAFKLKILSCVRAWEDWAIYPKEYLVRLQNMFLGLVKSKNETNYKKETSADSHKKEATSDNDSESDVDGKPLDEEETIANLDGEPLETDTSKFVASKWEQVDPEALEKQAVTTSKWDFFDIDQSEQAKTLNSSLKMLTSYGNDEDDEDSGDVDGKPMDDDDLDGKPFDDNDNEDIDGKPMDNSEQITQQAKKSWMDETSMSDENKRKLLREIEVQVVKYIDDLETGQENKQTAMSSEKYRETLLNEAEQKYKSTPQQPKIDHQKVLNKSRSRSSSSESEKSSSRRYDNNNKKQKKRSKSRSPHSHSRSYHSGSQHYSSSSSNNRKKYR